MYSCLKSCAWIRKYIEGQSMNHIKRKYDHSWEQKCLSKYRKVQSNRNFVNRRHWRAWRSKNSSILWNMIPNRFQISTKQRYRNVRSMSHWDIFVRFWPIKWDCVTGCLLSACTACWFLVLPVVSCIPPYLIAHHCHESGRSITLSILTRQFL